MGETVVGIDIGTSKVCTVIGQINDNNQIDIIGRGTSPCTGLKKGIIVDIEGTSSSIHKAVGQAESISNLKIGSAYVNITGMHVTVINNTDSINISGENREITCKDVERVLYAARNVTIPEDKEIIDIIPRQYIIDGYDEIIDPVGMVGVKLEAEVDVVLGKITSVQNILKSMERANIRIDGLVIESFAAGEVLLTPEEKEIGCILIDVGGGITDISIFKGKRLIFYDSITVGGDHITKDISIGLKISYLDAEKIKREYELALTSLIKNDQEITVTEINENKKKNIKVSKFVEIIEARVHEIFTLSRKLIENQGIDVRFLSGMVLTGGGISYLDGGIQLAYEVFDIPVRVATFKINGSHKIEFATAAGIVKYCSGKVKVGKQGSDIRVQKQRLPKKEPTFKKIIKWFGKFY